MGKRDFKEALAHRRSYYAIGNGSSVLDKEIEDALVFALMNVPSAFNSQSTRLVLLLGEQHRKLWDIVKETLRKMVSEEQFLQTEQKIDKSFASGYGTILYFEDEEVVKGLQKSFPTYADKFPQWSEHTSAMHQLALWVVLEDMGFGASLQHYNPLIDAEVKKIWNLPVNWRLIAQMPFGMPLAVPGDKEHQPVVERMKVFK